MTDETDATLNKNAENPERLKHHILLHRITRMKDCVSDLANYVAASKKGNMKKKECRLIRILNIL